MSLDENDELSWEEILVFAYKTNDLNLANRHLKTVLTQTQKMKVDGLF